MSDLKYRDMVRAQIEAIPKDADAVVQSINDTVHQHIIGVASIMDDGANGDAVIEYTTAVLCKTIRSVVGVIMSPETPQFVVQAVENDILSRLFELFLQVHEETTMPPENTKQRKKTVHTKH